MDKNSNFYTVYICTYWIRLGLYICLIDYFLMGLSYFYFKLDIPWYYYIAQIIPGTIYFFYMEYSMISSYKLRKRTYLFIRKLLIAISSILFSSIILFFPFKFLFLTNRSKPVGILTSCIPHFLQSIC